jgi:hypothetical protein
VSLKAKVSMVVLSGAQEGEGATGKMVDSFSSLQHLFTSATPHWASQTGQLFSARKSLETTARIAHVLNMKPSSYNC